MHTTIATEPLNCRNAEQNELIRNEFGHFSKDGSEYHITDYNTPRPWSNIIANERMGLAVTQAGSGFTWIDNSQLGVITRWQQDLVRDNSGKFLYVKDTETDEVWSLSPAPVFPAYTRYLCRHGLGYTVFETEFAGIHAEWTLFCHAEKTAELWHVKLHNNSDKPRKLEICSFLEWSMGVTPDPRREFHKLFIETWADEEIGAICAKNHMWDVPSPRWGHWNTDFAYTAAMASTLPVDCMQGDKAAFFGRHVEPKRPAAIDKSQWNSRFGRYEDPIGAMRSTVELKPKQHTEFGYVLAISTDQDSMVSLVKDLQNTETIKNALEDAKRSWKELLASHRVDTPDASVNYLTNDWLRYQAISSRIWGRCGYYQQSGAYGFRDQLQDSQVWLPIDPAKTRAQINLHARHQFADGSVYHWWHPLTEQGLVTTMTDDLLWMAFVTANYIRETGDLSILEDQAAFLDDDTATPLLDHVQRAFARVFKRTSDRGLPHIGAGDWNDGLSAVGMQDKGESIWLAHFLAGLLADWTEIYSRIGDEANARDFKERRQKLVAAINEHGWDGQWYIRATRDDGSKLGSSEEEVGKIFLNAQTWAILNDVAPAERAESAINAVEKHLVTEVGSLLLTPAFYVPDETVGYITRYAPGLRENGGVYTHAACWAIAAACKMNRPELAQRMLDALNPAKRDPQRYWAEPYVTPGNVDGPESPYYGRGGWTWYTGSAAWLQRVITDWILGVRADWDGLRVQPCLPPDWDHASICREFRGSRYNIEIERMEADKSDGKVCVVMNGMELPDNLIPAPGGTGETHNVVVRF